MRLRLIVLAVAVALGGVAWLFFRDAGITASIAFAVVYILLISMKVPLDHWIRADNLQSMIEAGKNTAISLEEPCPANEGVSHRHVHFAEVIDKVSVEKMCRAYGALKLSEKLIRDVRHDWERCIWIALSLLVIWGVLSFGKVSASSSTEAATTGPVVAASFDWWKGGLTALVGFYKFATSVDLLHWFRKQNSQI